MTSILEESQFGRDRQSPAQRRPGWVVLAAAVAFLAGLGAGWAAFGDGDASDSGTASTYVTPGSDELTARQTEMVELVEQYMAAWSSTDGQRLEALMVEDGYVEYAEEGWRFELDDGSLQDRVSNGPYDTIENHHPMLVYKDRIVLTGRVNSVGVDWLSVIRFTTTGDVKVISETLYL